MSSGLLDNFNGWKCAFFVIIVMVVVRIVHPPTAEWILAPIVDLAGAAIQAARDLGGTP